MAPTPREGYNVCCDALARSRGEQRRNGSVSGVLSARSRNGVPVRLTEERWAHVIQRHPELRNQQQRILETIAEPDLIQHGDWGELLAIRLYRETPLTRKHLVVAYRELGPEDGFVLTAYLTTTPSPKRILLWKR